MTLPAARLGDPTMHGGMIAVGCPTVLIGMKPAARIGDMHACPMVTVLVPHVGGPLALGAFTVLVGGVPQSRQTDLAICVGPPDAVAMGEPTVLVGMVGAGGAGGMMGAMLGGALAGLANFLGGYPRAVQQPDGSYMTEYSENIHIKGTPEFQAKVIRDLDVLNNTKAGKRLIDSFKGTGKTVTITETGAQNGGASPADGTKATNGTGTDSTITYNPNFSSMYNSGPTAVGQPGRQAWMDTTPPVILGHELVHAHHNAKGTNDFTIEGERMAVGLPPQTGFPKDHSGQSVSENALRDDLGQPKRTTYSQNGPP